jgi:hypothetical protein
MELEVSILHKISRKFLIHKKCNNSDIIYVYMTVSQEMSVLLHVHPHCKSPITLLTTVQVSFYMEHTLGILNEKARSNNNERVMQRV